MTQEESEEDWDRADEKAHAKWGTLTRSERVEFAGRWQKRHLPLYEDYGISEEVAEHALSVQEQSSPGRDAVPPGEDMIFPALPQRRSSGSSANGAAKRELRRPA